MKSDIYKLPYGATDYQQFTMILDEVSKLAAYNSLDKKKASHLRLLAEELICMLPEILSFSEGEFWVENDGSFFELHTLIKPNTALTWDKREKVLNVSSSGKNAAAKGILNKILLTVEWMLIDSDNLTENLTSNMYNFYDMGRANIPAFAGNSWSLDAYRKQAEGKNDEDWDELEKSIIANVADDVIVGMKSNQVDIIVRKKL